MTQQLRTLGLALLAVFAMSAIAASGAQATTGIFEWESGATHATATEDGPIIISTTAGEIECNEYHATLSLIGEPGTHTSTSATTLETTAMEYTHNGEEACDAGFFEPTLEMNGCDFVLHAKDTVGDPGAGHITATTDLVCPEGGIVINGGFLCTIEFTPQEGLSGVTVTTKTNETTEKEDLTIEHDVEGTVSHHSGFCGNGTDENGTYVGNQTLTATDGSGAPKHITVT